MMCTTLSPAIKNGCKVQGQVYTSGINDPVIAQVSTDLTNWTNVGTAATGSNTRYFVFDLSSYVGSKIYIRIYCSASGQTTHSFTLNSCSVII